MAVTMMIADEVSGLLVIFLLLLLARVVGKFACYCYFVICAIVDVHTLLF